ncbi:hypothetical protein TNCV_888131 [Trichonephila clavipes]|nr:hypothetical protein TNCV_888131 [Trichonephila clavipes]
MVKVTDSWLMCHEFEPSAAEDLPCRGGRCSLNLSRLKRPPVGVVWKLGEEIIESITSLITPDPSEELRGKYAALSKRLSMSGLWYSTVALTTIMSCERHGCFNLRRKMCTSAPRFANASITDIVQSSRAGTAFLLWHHTRIRANIKDCGDAAGVARNVFARQWNRFQETGHVRRWPGQGRSLAAIATDDQYINSSRQNRHCDSDLKTVSFGNRTKCLKPNNLK